MKRYALIVAAGSGTRMGSSLAKQFILLAGKPLLMHTLKRFQEADESIQLVVVLPAREITFWKGLCHQHAFTIPHEVTAGGDTRFHSVRNGLSHVPDDCVVAIHDGVRPFVNRKLILHCFDEAAIHGNAVPFVPVHESLRKVSADGSEKVDRLEYLLVQTPQCFVSDTLKKAYASVSSTDFTDDASVVEEAGTKIHLVQGLKENIKITSPPDLLMAEGLVKSFRSE